MIIAEVRGGRDDRRGARLELLCRETGPAVWVEGCATEESPDSSGRDGG